MIFGETIRSYVGRQLEFRLQSVSGPAIRGNRGMQIMNDDDDAIESLPAHYEDDGFNAVEPNHRVIIGSLLKCIDGTWSESGITMPAGTRLFALATTRVLQRWQDQRAVETIIKKPLPDLETLNKTVPKHEWELDLNGKPRPPWQLTFVVYLLDPATCEKFTYANSTVGASIAVETLQDRVAWMRRLRGANVVPEVELSCKRMKTRNGVKQRPEFKIIAWRDLGGGQGTPQLQPATAEQIAKTVEPPSLSEELDDEIPIA
jgi:hypothetical protein